MRASVLSSMKVEIYSRMAAVELTDTQEYAILTHRGAHADQHRYRRSPDAAGHAQQRRPNKARSGRRGVAAVDPDQGPGQHPPLARKGDLAGRPELIPSPTGGEGGRGPRGPPRLARL